MKFEEHNRAYFFSNMYLGSLQHGLQAGHVIGEMTVKYAMDENGPATPQADMFKQWVKYHKTMIILNAGYQSVLEEIEALFAKSKYPYASFREEATALNGAMTSVGIVLPNRMIIAAQGAKAKHLANGDMVEHILLRPDAYGNGAETEDELKIDLDIIEWINSTRMAN